MAEVENILISIDAEADKAEVGIEKLSSALSRIKNSIDKIDLGKLGDIRNTLNGIKISGEASESLNKFASSLSRLASLTHDTVSSAFKDAAMEIAQTFGMSGKSVKDLEKELAKASKYTEDVKDEIQKDQDGFIVVPPDMEQSFFAFATGANSALDTITNHVWSSRRVVKELGDEYTTLMEKVQTANSMTGRINLDFGVAELGEDAKELQKIVGKGFKFDSNGKTDFSSWLEGLDPSEITLINSYLSEQEKATNDVAARFRALAQAISDYKTQAKGAAAVETEQNTSKERARETIAGYIKELRELQEVGKTSIIQPSAINEESIKRLEAFGNVINTINPSPEAGPNLKSMAVGLKSIANSLVNMSGIEPARLTAISDAINKVGSSLSNLGSNNRINVKIDAEGIKKDIKPLNTFNESAKRASATSASTAKNEEALQQAMANLGIDAEQTGGRLSEVANEIKNIQTVLNGFKAGKVELDDESVVRYTNRLAQLNEEYKTLSHHGMPKFDFEGLAKESGEVAGIFRNIANGANAISGASRTAYNLVSTLLKVATSPVKLFGGKIISDLKNTGKAFQVMGRKAQDSLKKIQVFWNRAMKTFTFMLVRKAITGILMELDTAKQSLALWSDFVGTKFNESVSNIQADCMWIARSIVAAFEPLINAVAPIIDFISEKISAFLAKVGEFFAAITGQSYYVKAKKNVSDYAKSLQKANKTAKGALQSFDEINNITTNKSSGDSPVDTFKNDWDMAPVSKEMNDFAQKVKDIADDLWYPIGKAWDAMKEYVLAGWKYMTSEIASLAKDMWADFIEVWKEDATVEIFKNIFGIVGDIEYVIGNIVRNFHAAWNYGKTGLQIFRNIRDVIGILVQHVRNVTLYMKDWSSGLNFIPLLKSVEQLTGSFKRVAEFIGGEFEDIMKLGVLKFVKWFIEKGLPDINKAFAEIFDSIDFDKVRKDLKPVISAIERLFENLVGGATKAFKNLGKNIAKFLNSEDASKMAKNFSKILDVFTEDRIATVLEGIGDAFLGIAEAIGKIALSDSVVKFFEWLGKMVDEKGVEGIAKDIGFLVGQIAGFATLTSATSVIGKIASSLAGLMGVIGGVARWKALQDIQKTLEGMGNVGEVAKGINDVAKGANELQKAGGAGKVVSSIASAFKSLPSLMTMDVSTIVGAGTASEIGVTIGTGIAGGVVAGILGYQGGKWGAYALAKVFGDDEMANLYKNFDLAEGLASLIVPDQSVGENLKDMFDGWLKMITDFENHPAIASFAGIVSGPIGVAVGLFTNLKNVAEYALINVRMAFDEVRAKAEEVKNSVSSAWETMVANATSSLTALKDAVVSEFTLIGQSIATWYETNVAPWFSAEKWLELGENIRSSLKAKWDETAGQWLADLTLWWETSVAPWFTKEKWDALLSPIGASFKDAFKSGVNAAITFLNKMLEGLETLLTGASDVLGWFKDKLEGMNITVPVEFSPIKLPRIPTFQSGGFPEDGLFMANHNELVGGFNGRTAVANNDQIISGIASGVQNANAEQSFLMAQMIDLLGVIAEKDLTIGDDAIYNSYRRGATRYAKRYGV